MKRSTLKKLKSIQKNTNNNLVTQETWLPVFTGYYESIFDGSNDFIEYETQLTESEFKEYYSQLHESGVTFEFFKNELWYYCEFSECFEDASENITNAILYSSHSGIITDIKYQSTQSPKYYNFSTDSINCEITYNRKKLEKYLKENISEFKNYIESKYTSRDGFSSSYTNDYELWLDSSEWLDHELGSILNFVIFNNDDDAIINLYYESDISECFHGNVRIDYEKMISDFKNKAV